MLQKQLQETKEELASAKKEIIALWFYKATAAITKECLEKKVADLTEHANGFVTKFNELKAVVQTYENKYNITDMLPEHDDKMTDLIARINRLFISSHKSQEVSEPSSSQVAHNPLLKTSFFREQTNSSTQITSDYLTKNNTEPSEQPISLFEAIRTDFKKKFTKTNSSGIKAIIALMDKMTGGTEVALGIILVEMQAISQERVNRTLSKIGIMGGGRRIEAQQFYNMMKGIDLTTKDGIDQAVKQLQQFITTGLPKLPPFRQQIL